MKKDQLYLNVYKDCYNGMSLEESMEINGINNHEQFKAGYNTWMYVNFDVKGLGDVIVEWVKIQNEKS
jgi:hypothetical protein